jgi:transcriptional regulator with XRE-family HTH domain
MNELLWIGPTIQRRRKELGLTQTALARLTGVSRATVNGIESGHLANLSLGRLARLLQLLGVSLQWAPEQNRSHRFLALAAKMCSVSYSETIPSAVLADALSSGLKPAAYQAHIITLIDEVPFQVIAGAVEAAALMAGMPPAKVWKHLGAWACAMQSPRKEWHGF